MKTFKNFLMEIRSGTYSRGFTKPGEEHDEVHHQLETHEV
jgi:hypothetical protein